MFRFVAFKCIHLCEIEIEGNLARWERVSVSLD